MNSGKNLRRRLPIRSPLPRMNSNLTTGHCFICLKKGGGDGDLHSSTLSSAILQREVIKSFHSILCYLTGLPHERSDDEDDGHGHGFEEEEEDSKTAVFQDILRKTGDKPPLLCEQCNELLAFIDKRHNELVEIQREIEKQVQVVRKHVQSTIRIRSGRKDGTRRDSFVESMAIDDGSDSLVLRIHDEIISKGSHPIKFPVHSSPEEDEWIIPENEESPPTPINEPTHVLSSTPGLSVLGTPVNPQANFVMVATNVTDPTTGAVTVQHVLLDVAQLQSQIGNVSLVQPSSAVVPPTPGSSLSVVTPPPSSRIAPEEQTFAPLPQSQSVVQQLTPESDVAPLTPTAEPDVLKTPASESISRPIPHVKKSARTPHSNDPTADPSDLQETQPCDVCNSQIQRGPQLISHLEGHVGSDYVFSCEDCKCAFISSYRLDHFHESGHSGCSKRSMEIYKCDLCAFQGDGMQKFEVHIKSHENDNIRFPSRPHKCPLCLLHFKSKKSVQVHLGEKHICSTKIGRQRYDLCPHAIFSPHEISNHLKAYHKVTDLFPCKLCPHISSSLELYMIHQQMSAKQFNEKKKKGHPKSCHLCPDVTKFLKMDHLRLHYFEVHGLGAKHICEICNAEFLSKDKWSEHQRKHRDITEEENPTRDLPNPPKKPKLCTSLCPECGKSFVAPKKLAEHRIRLHGQPRLECTHSGCEETFISEHSRNLHIRRDHEGFTVITSKDTLPHTCDQCGTSFPTKSALDYHHYQKHSEEKKFSCELCGAQFKWRNGLKSHMTYTHLKVSKEKIFLCDICNRGFTTQMQVKKHKLVHTGERPFACQHCGQRFRQRETLTTHERSHEKLGDKFKPKGEMERNK